jgi:hypothetical protein
MECQSFRLHLQDLSQDAVFVLLLLWVGLQCDVRVNSGERRGATGSSSDVTASMCGRAVCDGIVLVAIRVAAII